MNDWAGMLKISLRISRGQALTRAGYDDRDNLINKEDKKTTINWREKQEAITNRLTIV